MLEMQLVSSYRMMTVSRRHFSHFCLPKLWRGAGLAVAKYT